MRRWSLTLVLAAVLTGCGSQTGEEAKPAGRSDRLVDFRKKPPFVNALDTTEDGALLLTTNRGFWRIDPEATPSSRCAGRSPPTASPRPSAHSSSSRPPGRGGSWARAIPTRPDAAQLPRPDRVGRRRPPWRVISRLGDADLHKIVLKHDRLYACDAVLGAMLISRDEGARSPSGSRRAA